MDELIEKPFQLQLNGVTITVKPLALSGYRAFEVSFSSSRKPLIVARTKDFDKNIFYTSIPQGRQKEAEGVGKLIEEYYKKKEEK